MVGPAFADGLRCLEQNFLLVGDHFLVVANMMGESALYVFAAGQFHKERTFATSGAHAWASFTVAGVPHLAVANAFAAEDGSKIYAWCEQTGCRDPYFEEAASIPAPYIHDIKAFTIDEVSYLVVASKQDAPGNNAAGRGVLYSYGTDGINEISSVPAFATYNVGAFLLHGVQHYTVCGHHADNMAPMNLLYAWNGESFEEVMDIGVNNPMEAFEIDGTSYLLVANRFFRDTIALTRASSTATLTSSTATLTSTLTSSTATLTSSTATVTSSTEVSTSSTTSSSPGSGSGGKCVQLQKNLLEPLIAKVWSFQDCAVGK